MASTPRLESAAFTIEAGTVTKTASLSSSRVALHFQADAKRHFDGGFDCSVVAQLFDAEGRLVGQRMASREKRAIGNRASWSHEVDSAWFAHAAKLVYEIEFRFDVRRELASGDIEPLPTDPGEYARWIDIDPELLVDRAVAFDIGVWSRPSEVVITYAQRPTFLTTEVRTEMELDLFDADGKLCHSVPFNISLNLGHPAYYDQSPSIDRTMLKALRFYELRGRTQASGIAKLVVDRLPT